MGARLNWHLWKYWIEYQPLVYLRINKKQDVGYKTIYESWR